MMLSKLRFSIRWKEWRVLGLRVREG